jgi:hypothetical protein
MQNWQDGPLKPTFANKTLAKRELSANVKPEKPTRSMLEKLKKPTRNMFGKLVLQRGGSSMKPPETGSALRRLSLKPTTR